MFEYSAYVDLNSHKESHPVPMALPQEGPGGTA